MSATKSKPGCGTTTASSNRRKRRLFVRVDNFNASSIDFPDLHLHQDERLGRVAGNQGRIRRCRDGYHRKGRHSFAFPSQTIYMQETDPPEIMSPPAPSESVEHAQQMIADSGKRRGMGEADDDG
jgi:MscS family membrane protein